jgi:hypothetical protein
MYSDSPCTSAVSRGSDSVRPATRLHLAVRPAFLNYRVGFRSCFIIVFAASSLAYALACTITGATLLSRALHSLSPFRENFVPAAAAASSASSLAASAAFALQLLLLLLFRWKQPRLLTSSPAGPSASVVAPTVCCFSVQVGLTSQFAWMTS